MHLSRNCPFSNKTNLHLELPGEKKGLRHSDHKKGMWGQSRRLALLGPKFGHMSLGCLLSGRTGGVGDLVLAKWAIRASSCKFVRPFSCEFQMVRFSLKCGKKCPFQIHRKSSCKFVQVRASACEWDLNTFGRKCCPEAKRGPKIAKFAKNERTGVPLGTFLARRTGWATKKRNLAKGRCEGETRDTPRRGCRRF